ncbi:hypothetical protein BZZ01_11785 [Nostocales cyanobacterium HT-58-2]|nr:hypothetical protein BZZ01_11785 [Nostocales cyanobacterium HT-58-2]
MTVFQPDQQLPGNTKLSREALRKRVEQEKEKAQAKARTQLVREAFDTVKETENAIAAIENDKTEEALQALERVTGKLDIILARKPQLALVPINSSVEIVHLVPLDVNLVREMRSEIKNAIANEDLLEARQLLNTLANEVRVTTVNLPLATYPDAMKEAARLIDAGKKDLAKNVLEDALSTLVITEKYLPIPVIYAQALVDEASQVVDKDKDQARSLLAEAREQLKLAEELGYGKRDREYANLEQAIASLDRQVRTGEGVAAAFKTLQDQLSSFFQRISV